MRPSRGSSSTGWGISRRKASSVEEDGFRMVVAEVRGTKIERVLVTKK